MKLRDLLNTINAVSIRNGISKPWIVGGIPRDKILGLIKPNELNDLDITTGDKTVHNLAVEVELELKKKYTLTTKTGDDGHKSIIFPGNKFKLDFSSNFISPHIDKYLFNNGIKNPTNMQREVFSRDFTVNSLLMDLSLRKIKDPTHKGLIDIKKKILKTCLDTDTTLRYNTNRIIRVVYLSAKLDFDVDPEIISWISKNKELVRISSDAYLIKNIEKAMSKNPDRALYVINKTNLWDVIPTIDSLRPFINKKNVIKSARRQDDLEILKKNVGNYIHFSNSERFGISFHKDIHPGNPRGVYGFPLTTFRLNQLINTKFSEDEFGYMSDHKEYIYIFNVKGNILNLDNFDLQDVSKRIKDFLVKNYPSNYHLIYYPEKQLYRHNGPALLEWVRNICSDYKYKKVFNNEHSAINIIFRGAGYDALETRMNGFDDDIQSEIAVLNPAAVNLIAKINNPMLFKSKNENITRTDQLNKKDQENLIEYEKNLKDPVYLEKIKKVYKGAQLRKNYDLGEGFYSNLEKYKSVSDFRKKRRKKRMIELKKIKDMKLK